MVASTGILNPKTGLNTALRFKIRIKSGIRISNPDLPEYF
jgi:hypothetical protein